MSRIDFDDDPYVVIERHDGSIGSFFLGLAIGAGVALLFAPQTGAATRRRIRRSAEKVKDAAVDTYEEARAQVEERIEAARHQVEVRKQQVSRAVSAGREAAQQAREDLERRIEETKAAYRADADDARTSRAARSEASRA